MLLSVMWSSGSNLITTQSFSNIAVHNSTPKHLMFPFKTLWDPSTCTGTVLHNQCYFLFI